MIRIIIEGRAETMYATLCKKTREQQIAGKTTSEEIQLLRSLNEKLAILQNNAFYGDNIAKRKIPQTYNVQNLWRVELAHFWRMLYTIKGNEKETICFIIDIVDHQAYDKKFKYRGK